MIGRLKGELQPLHLSEVTVEDAIVHADKPVFLYARLGVFYRNRFRITSMTGGSMGCGKRVGFALKVVVLMVCVGGLRLVAQEIPAHKGAVVLFDGKDL